MATRAKYLGAAGVIIDGRFRDVQEIQEMGLPVLTYGPRVQSLLLTLSRFSHEALLSWAPIHSREHPRLTFL